MGALHQGHLSLCRIGRQQADHAVATIFVNPTQFGPGEDFDRYPRSLEDDLASLRGESVDAVFLPSVETMYPPNSSTTVSPPRVAQPLEGDHRPGHFAGVATIVMKLFQILPATHAVFGRKDYQQYQVIAAMTRDLNVDIEVIAAPIVRESDGLAMSSRNRYLNASQRATAIRIFKSLQLVQQQFADGQSDVNVLQQTMRETLLQDGGDGGPVDKIDYAVIRDPHTLQPIDTATGQSVALIAAHVGQTRLIDNVTLDNQIV